MKKLSKTEKAIIVFAIIVGIAYAYVRIIQIAKHLNF